MPGPQELAVIALVALFVLGPERLPIAARWAARGLAKLRTYSVSATRELRGVADLGDIEREVHDLRRELARTRAEMRRALRETMVTDAGDPVAGGIPGNAPGDAAEAGPARPSGSSDRAADGQGS